jgi:sugar phosphate isomerase/epimerase
MYDGEMISIGIALHLKLKILFADNNRKMPGYGHIDFQAIVKSLRNIGYN